jgi:hypothetical protein
MRSDLVVILTATAVVLAGCSSKPRNFAPVLAAAPTDATNYEAQWLACREQVAASIKAGSGRAASTAGGVAAGAGGAAAVGAATAGTYATMGGAMAALVATIIAAPIAAIGGAWGISKIKKTKKERAIKAATAECLARAGYSVESWRVMKKREVHALPAASTGTTAPAPTAPATAGEAALPTAVPR